MIPAVPRIPDVRDMINGKFYFVLHAPRQSGKTTCLKALTKQINSEGKYYAINCSLITLRNTSDPATAMKSIVGLINIGIENSDIADISKLAYTFDDRPFMSYHVSMVRSLLKNLCLSLDRELVVFFDEADCLLEDPLIMFLGQIRDGYLDRFDSPASRFPRSMALVGMRDIRDFLTKVRPDGMSTGPANPFNVKLESLTLADFTMDEIRSLYGQHTAETGQVFETSAVDRAWYWTEGQPWLVNALANNVIVKQFRNDYSKVISGNDIDIAVRNLILRNDTHFDSLMERVREPRVRRVIEPVITGVKFFPKSVPKDDIRYVIDLGLLKADGYKVNSIRSSNPIYRELIARAMSQDLQDMVPSELANRWMDGTRLDMDGLLRAFQVYWRENSEANDQTDAEIIKRERLLTKRVVNSLDFIDIAGKYRVQEEVVKIIMENISGFGREDFPHIVLYAFLQRVLNGGADFIQREYGLGRSFVDICVSYKDIRYPVELKVKGVKSREDSIAQVLGYMDKCGSSVGWLVVFDRDCSKSWDEIIFWETFDRDGRIVHLVGC
jgi:hypothetical protein